MFYVIFILLFLSLIEPTVVNTVAGRSYILAKIGVVVWIDIFPLLSGLSPPLVHCHLVMSYVVSG